MLVLSFSLQHAVLHNDFVVYFHKHAIALVPESRLAVAVASAGAGDHMRQAQIVTREVHRDELILRLERSHYRLPVRAAKAEPILLRFHFGSGATQYCRQHHSSKPCFGHDFHLGQKPAEPRPGPNPNAAKQTIILIKYPLSILELHFASPGPEFPLVSCDASNTT